LLILTSVGKRYQIALVNCAASLAFVLDEDLVMRMGLKIHKSATKVHEGLANGQRVATNKVCEVLFIISKPELVHAFHDLRDLLAADIVLSLPWFDDEQTTLMFG
jgi:hypothetical protein